MNNIDFSKAPEGSEGYSPETEDYYVIWYKDVSDDSYLACSPDDVDFDFGWHRYFKNDEHFNKHKSRIIKITKETAISIDEEKEIWGSFKKISRAIGFRFGVDVGYKNLPDEIEGLLKSSVLCKTEREQMLCEQVLRVIRGEASQQLVNTYWKDVPPDHIINIDKLIRYRAKPKKELVVPWEWISDEYNSFAVRANNSMFAFNDNDQLHQVEVRGLKLDLTDIELPVTVKRPSEK